jgi:hypothetical protein
LANSIKPRELSGEEGLLLIIRNERSIEAADLAELLGSLAKDYRKISNGGELIIGRLSQGSLIALLHDAAGVFSDMNSLIVFGKTLVALTSIALGASAGASKLLNGRKAGTQTVKSLAKIASTYDGEVEMMYQRSLLGKEEFHLKLNSREAKRIQDIASAQASSKQIAAQQPTLSESAAPHLLGPGSTRQISDALVRLAKRDDGQTLSDIRALIDAIVGTLAAHNSEYVSEIVAELEAQGQYAVAQLLRDAFERSTPNRNSNPPLIA